MESDNTDRDESESPDRPDCEVWNHLESGLQVAYDDMKRVVGEDMRCWEALAKAVVSLRMSLLVSGSIPELRDSFTPESQQALLKALATPPLPARLHNRRCLSESKVRFRHPAAPCTTREPELRAGRFRLHL